MIYQIFYKFSFSAVFKTVTTKGKHHYQVCKLWIGPRLVVFLFDPRDVEILLSSQTYIDKSSEYDFFKPWLGDGLLISTGEFQHSYKQLITSLLKLDNSLIALHLLNLMTCGNESALN